MARKNRPSVESIEQAIEQVTLLSERAEAGLVEIRDDALGEMKAPAEQAQLNAGRYSFTLLKETLRYALEEWKKFANKEESIFAGPQGLKMAHEMARHSSKLFIDLLGMVDKKEKEEDRDELLASIGEHLKEGGKDANLVDGFFKGQKPQ